MQLPEGWRPLNGISGSGWDIWLGIDDNNLELNFAIFRRRIEETETYTMGRPGGGNEAFKRMDLIKTMFHQGKVSFEELFADDVAWEAEVKEQEQSERALRALPTYGRF